VSDLPPPGYYPDPDNPSQRRWWDGAAWGPIESDAHQSPSPEELGRAFALERSIGLIARAALILGIVLFIAGAVASAFTAPDTRAQFKEAFNAIEQGRQPKPTASDSGLAATIGQLANLGTLAVGVAFAAWCFRAARVARALRLPDAWPPGWALGGWFIPLASFVIPYFVVRGFFAPDDPRRSAVGRWWSAWIAMSVGGLLITIVPLFTDVATGFILACALAYAVVVVSAGLAARAVILDVMESHAALAGVTLDHSPNE